MKGYGKYGKAGCVTDGRVTRFWIAGLNGFLATTCDDQIYIYDVKTLRICFITRHFPSKISNFDGCHKYLIASVGNKLYYTERLKIIEIDTSHTDSILGCIIVGQSIVSYSNNKLVVTARNEAGDFIESHSTLIDNITLATKLKGVEQTILICSASDKTICLLDVNNYKSSVLSCLSTYGLKFIASGQSAQAGIIALLTSTSKIFIIDTITDELLITIQIKDIASLSFVEKGDNEYLVLSTATSGLLSIFNLETRVIEYMFNANTLAINQLEYCYNMGTLMCIGDNCIVSLVANSPENFFKIEKYRKGHPAAIIHIQHYGKYAFI